ncbi:MAG: RES family NAD+ phosphorylase [Acidimicrobiales bacterium]
MTLRQGESTCFRVADPDWEDPFDGSHSMRRGQRWNARGSFPVTYLNANEETAEANAQYMLQKVAGIGVDADDLERGQLPVIIPCVVPERTVLDVISDAGCLDAGLETTYPLDAHGAVVPHSRCQPIGLSAWEAGLDGIGCRSAALLGEDGRELAWFDRSGKRLAPSGPARPYSP